MDRATPFFNERSPFMNNHRNCMTEEQCLALQKLLKPRETAAQNDDSEAEVVTHATSASVQKNEPVAKPKAPPPPPAPKTSYDPAFIGLGCSEPATDPQRKMLSRILNPTERAVIDRLSKAQASRIIDAWRHSGGRYVADHMRPNRIPKEWCATT